jgi:riboflavin kinase / FMN adenylyltransferase
MNALYTITGVVLHGDKRGRALGFPTANMHLDEKIPDGIYAAEVDVDGVTYKAASFVGAAETFEKTETKLESYLFDFDEDIYGKTITVTLYKKIRGNKKFDSVDGLIEQMKKDVEAIKRFF